MPSIRDRSIVICVSLAADIEKESLKETIKKHKQQIAELKRQSNEHEKERQAELVKLRLEVRYHRSNVSHNYLSCFRDHSGVT